MRFIKKLLFHLAMTSQDLFDMKLELTSELAEIVGIMFGDGCLYLDRLNKYQTIVAFNLKERDYLYYVKKLFETYLTGYHFCITENKDELLLRNTSIFVGKRLIKAGLKAGNKVKNRISVPKWIFNNKLFLMHFMRGLFDTDGCIYRKYGSYMQIQFKLACKESINSVYCALKKLSFNPSKVQEVRSKQYFAWKIYLCRQDEIRRFFDLIQPKNMKHLNRYEKLSGDGGI